MTCPDFDATTPILDFGVTHRDLRYESGTCVRFAWPVYACDIVCTLRQHAPVNLFQEHILRVLHARAARPEEIASILCLDLGIVEKVLSELESMRWLDRHHVLTDTALAYLTTEEETTPISGTIFLDASSAKNRFVHPILVSRDLAARRVEISEANKTRYRVTHFEINTGTAGKPHKTRIEVPEVSAKPFTPRDAQIIDALAQSMRHTTRYRALGLDYQFDLVTGPVRDLSMIASEPRPHYIHTYAFVPEGESYWMVCDPFGRGASMAYRRLAQQSQALHSICKKSLSLARKHIVPSDDVHSMHHTALERLCDTLAKESEALDRHEVMSLIHAHQELADRLGAWSAHRSIADAWACLELLFACSIAEISSDARIDAVMQSLPESPTSSGPVTVGKAIQLGFTVSNSTRSWLEQVTRARIKGVLKDGNTIMNAVVSAALTMHARVPDSSWHQLGLFRPGLLDTLCGLNELRKQELHESDQMRDSVQIGEVERLVLDCVHVLVLHQRPSREETSSAASDDAFDAMRRRRQARLKAMDELDAHERLDAQTKLHLENLLTELLSSSMMCREFDDHSHAYAARVIRRSYVLAEFCIGRISDVNATRTQTLLDVDVEIDVESNARRLQALHEELGGKGSVDMFGRANPQMVMRQLRHHRPKGLSPHVWKCLLDAQKDPAHPLRSMMSQDPKFFAHINEIARLRGHGDQAIAPGRVAYRVARQIKDILTLTLTTLLQDDVSP